MATQNKKLLIIDDDQEIKNLLNVFLKKTYTLSFAGNGEEALAVLKAEERLPDLILLDMEMPVMNGPEFRKNMKTLDKYKHIPIMYLTANNQFRDKVDHDFEFDFINKPVEKEDLLTLLETFFQTQR
jgi:CheY-like chemotaxis protein